MSGEWVKVILNKGGSGEVRALDADGYRLPCYDEVLIDTIIADHQLAAKGRAWYNGSITTEALRAAFKELIDETAVGQR
jgi:hypothetical protein